LPSYYYANTMTSVQRFCLMVVAVVTSVKFSALSPVSTEVGDRGM